jgi:nuclear transport factor 2 (NTF2) superfamily protein
MARPPIPPFTEQAAIEKARLAEDGWNSRDPATVALAYTPNSQWRNRAEFLSGRIAIEAFLARKWTRELDYRLIKELWPLPTTASRFASPTNTTTTAGNGFALMVTRTGNSRRMA